MAKIRPQPKPKKQIKITDLRKKVWTQFSKYIRLRDNYTCYTCGKVMLRGDSNCHAGHYVPQSKGNRLRFDERNVHAQCVTCNSFNRGNLSAYALRLEQDYGHGILQEFDSVRNERKQFTRDELLEMLDHYKGLVDNWDKMGEVICHARLEE